jgi:hypothetical protein
MRAYNYFLAEGGKRVAHTVVGGRVCGIAVAIETQMQ